MKMIIDKKVIANMTFYLRITDKYEKICIFSYSTKICQITVDFDGIDIEVDGHFYSKTTVRHLGIALAIAKLVNFNDIALYDLFSTIIASNSLKDLVRSFGYVGKQEKDKIFTDKAMLYIY